MLQRSSIDGNASGGALFGLNERLDRAFKQTLPVFPLGTMDTFVTYGAPANLIETVNTMGLSIYARQIARPDGSAIDVKTEASPLPVNKRPRLAVKIHASN
jgi:hypothetical protein